MQDYNYDNYDITGNKLTITVFEDFTIDLLPSILREILHALWLDTAESIEKIEIKRTHERTQT